MYNPHHPGTEHEYADLDEVRLHYAHTGRGPLILFLHGFPQCWYMYRHQLAEFGRDHLAVAPDLRGFNLSSKPERLHEYGPWLAAQDVRALVECHGKPAICRRPVYAGRPTADAAGPAAS